MSRRKVLVAVGVVLVILATISVFGNETETQEPRSSTQPQPTKATTQAVEPAATKSVAPEPTEEPQLTWEEVKTKAWVVDYKTLYRQIEDYKGQHVYFAGRVVQVLFEDDDTHVRVDVSSDFESLVILLLYYSGERPLDGDSVEFVAEVVELFTYEAVLGNKVTIPALRFVDGRLLDSVEQAESPAATPAPTETPLPEGTYSPGMYKVGTEIQPGTYKGIVPQNGSCYWARLNAPSGTSNIIANDHVSEGQYYVNIEATDAYFELERCTIVRVE